MSNISFNCDVCGRQVQGCTFVNGMKFCAKCYQETFGNTTENLNNIYEGYLKILNEKDQRIAELEEQLKNAIVPKFKIGQEVWYIDRYGVQKDIIVSFTYFSIENEILYKMHDEIIDHREKYIFATKEEAEAKLKDLQENEKVFSSDNSNTTC